MIIAERDWKLNYERKWYALAILNLLMNTNDYISTKQITEKIGCSRKSVYSAIDLLEVNGFHIDIIKQRSKPNRYKFIKHYQMY